MAIITSQQSLSSSLSLSMLFCVYLLILYPIRGIESIRIYSLELPTAIPRGVPVTLICDYDLEGDELYSVKFYKDFVEFYRYLPSESPSGQKFNLKGAYVDLSRSNSTHALLSGTDVSSSGTYACEVSTEGPSFSTIRAERQMREYVLPKEGLKIEGAEPIYDIDDTIDMNCSSSSASSPLELRWYVNDKMAETHQLVYYPPKRYSDGLQSFKLGLLFRGSSNYFYRGALALRCVALLTLTYQYETTLFLIGGTVRNKSNSGPYSSHWSIQSEHDGTPLIKGHKPKYKLGDLLDINCTTTATDAQLKFFMNEKDVNSSQLIEYRDAPQITLGLRFTMIQLHFRMQEVRLKCRAIVQRVIDKYSDEIIIKTYNNGYNDGQSEPAEENFTSGITEIVGFHMRFAFNFLISLHIWIHWNR